MIAVTVAQVSLSNVGFVVLLQSSLDKRVLPIFIGATEAQAIALFMDKVRVPRPMTHDLIKSLLDNLECRMKRVEIHDLRDNTFYASLVLETNGAEALLDARPSDAIALALRAAAPIFVDEKVMEAAGIFLNGAAAPDAQGGHAPARKLTPRDALREQLAKAVAEERYEDAARLRDELNKMTQAN